MQLLGRAQDLAAPAVGPFARLGEDVVPAAAGEELGLQPVLERADVTGDYGLGEDQLVGRAGDSSGLHDLTEDVELVEGDPQVQPRPQGRAATVAGLLVQHVHDLTPTWSGG